MLELTLEEANAEEEGTISFDKFKEVRDVHCMHVGLEDLFPCQFLKKGILWTSY